jgi:hypothetical protein
MLRIRYAAPRDLEISGTIRELQAISMGILNLVRSDQVSFAFTADAGYDPAPYRIAIPRLLITKGTDLLAVIVKDETLVHISGASNHLEALAAWFVFDPAVPSKTHAHFEYYEDHPFIASHSIPLVITVE